MSSDDVRYVFTTTVCVAYSSGGAFVPLIFIVIRIGLQMQVYKN